MNGIVETSAMPHTLESATVIGLIIFGIIVVILIIIAKFGLRRYDPEYYGYGQKKSRRRRGEYPEPHPGGFGPFGGSYGNAGNTGNDSSVGMVSRGFARDGGGLGR